ncbi:MAG: bifunctional folylpolyglutamate synthase/dihydrofolate synthase [Alphaproteobacteria bacterium]|nr:bifunctional folylpolyglutamate synthase/dihydrofolate synthase [Alphaproteobacteria bacterium]
MQKLHNRSDDPKLEARLEEILNLLCTLHVRDIDMDLSRVERFLARLDNPHLKLPPVIHVAGTNGKGSTIATLRALLEGAGKKVHSYTSPHLIHTTERIRLAGEPITTRGLIDLLEECLEVNRSEPITFFEIFTAAAFLAMARAQENPKTRADYILLETGLGGRLDATNVVPNPACTIITKISKDHMEFLGDTSAQIAAEKAGIMKAGAPCIIGYQDDASVHKVFQQISQNLSPASPLFRGGSEWSVKEDQSRVIFEFGDEQITTILPNLAGAHQIENCGAALAAYRIIMGQSMGQAFDDAFLSPKNPDNPLGKIFWPGRLQKLTTGSFDVPEHTEIWIDGGHNDSAGKALAAQAKIWQEQDAKSLHLVVGMLKRKNPEEFLTPLVPYVQSLTCTEIPDEPNSYSAQELYDKAKTLNFKEIHQEPNIKSAILNITRQNPGTPHRILLTGSLYFLDQVL